MQVAAGSTFCLALTANGKVVVWGKVPGQEMVEGDLAATLPLASGAAQGVARGKGLYAAHRRRFLR